MLPSVPTGSSTVSSCVKRHWVVDGGGTALASPPMASPADVAVAAAAGGVGGGGTGRRETRNPNAEPASLSLLCAKRPT